MTELINEALAIYNLPLTILMGVLLLYWVTIIIGAVAVESLDFDFDGEVDLDAGTGSNGNVGLLVLKFLNFGKVPVVIILSVLVVVLWTLSMLVNHSLNPGGRFLLAIGFFLVNLILSALLTKVLTAPLKKLFASLDAEGDTHDPIVGRTCVVKSLEVTRENGQAEVDRDGATFLINVRLSDGQDPLVRGDRALVVAVDTENDFFMIRKDSTTQIDTKLTK